MSEKKKEKEVIVDEQSEYDELMKKYTDAITNSKENPTKRYQASKNLNVALSNPKMNVNDLNDVNISNQAISNKMTTKNIPEEKKQEVEVPDEDIEQDVQKIVISKEQLVPKNDEKDYDGEANTTFSFGMGDIIALIVIIISIIALIYMFPLTMEAIRNT